MKVNEAKTDLCLFYKGDSTPITLNIYDKTISSNKSINILGVIVDSKLQSSDHIAHTIKRSTNALNAIKLIKKIFTQSELLTLIRSNFFSILYYNSEIWHLPSLKATLKQKLLSSSAKALKVWVKLSDNNVSFDTLHKICKRALPIDFMKYKLALCLFRIYNNDFNIVEFSHLNYYQVLTSRQTNIKHETLVKLNQLIACQALML